MNSLTGIRNLTKDDFENHLHLAEKKKRKKKESFTFVRKGVLAKCNTFCKRYEMKPPF